MSTWLSDILVPDIAHSVGFFHHNADYEWSSDYGTMFGVDIY